MTAAPVTAPTAAAIVAWIDSVFAEAGVDGPAELRRELANRFASLTTLGPIAVYALDHGADFSRWLVESDQQQAVDHIDDALVTVATLVSAQTEGDREDHLAALGVILDGVYAKQYTPWVHGVKTDYGS